MSRKPVLKIDVVTLFPSMFEGPFKESLLGRAAEAGLIQIGVHNLRQWSDDERHAKVDDRPFGGGAGMVIKAEPVARAIQALSGRPKPWVVFLSPQGKTLTQRIAQDLSKKRHLIFVCGHYEGIDERAMKWVNQEVSVGDYVLTGGELPAMVVTDAVARLVPGVVGDAASLVEESFSQNLLEYPHYTRPRRWRGKNVPAVLLSGNHAEIKRWREAEAKKRTVKKRPDLIRRKI